MAISSTLLAEGARSDNATSYDTASISPTANRLVLLAVYNRVGSGGPNTPTASGASMTWTQVRTVLQAGNIHRLTVFRALSASPGSGAVTIDFAGQTQSTCNYSITEFSGVLTTGTNGDGAVVQSASNSSSATDTGITVTLSAFGSTSNATYGAVAREPSATITVGSGFTEVQQEAAATEGTIQTQFKASNDTSVDWSWPSAAGTNVAIAIEIKAGGPASVKKVSGIAQASLKKVSTIAIASIKKISGVA